MNTPEDPHMPATHRPCGHEPRGGPAHEVRWPEDVHTVVLAQFGVQAPTREQAREAVERIVELTALPSGPSKVDLGWHVDATGVVNEVVIGYWTDPETHAAWWSSEQVEMWWTGLPLDGPIGHWHETLRTPVTRHETMYSAPAPAGPAALAQPMNPTDLHDYPYAALDRISDSEHDDFAAGTTGFETDLPAGRSPLGRRVTVTRVPDNLCLIRTAQDWSQAPEEQRRSYRELVEPGYRDGVDYLRDNAAESGCLSIRLLQDVSGSGEGADLPSTNTVAWWDGIADLLSWAHHHPTHHRILGDFWTGLVQPFAADLRLLLWHEVHVAAPDSVRMAYVNCHPGTGVLPHATKSIVALNG
jgi:aldoxime dehydratase